LATCWRLRLSRAAAFSVRAWPIAARGRRTWHHPLTVLDRPARFAVLIWLENSKTDEEFVTLKIPFTVDVPA
jgi:ureidoglycolate lyase